MVQGPTPTEGTRVRPASEGQRASVLVVDDEPPVADLYATWLEDRHEVTIANDGERALEIVDESIDVVLLDRHMPVLAGDEVLSRIEDRGLECRVVMVTAVDPDFDILEMPFDDYLTKPVGSDRLHEVIRTVLARERYDEELQEYFAMAAKKASLEATKHPTELERSEAYATISRRVEALEDEAAAAAASVDDPATLFQEFPGGE